MCQPLLGGWGAPRVPRSRAWIGSGPLPGESVTSGRSKRKHLRSHGRRGSGDSYANANWRHNSDGERTSRRCRGWGVYLKDCTCRGTFRLCSRSRHTSLETCRINFSAFKPCFCSSFDCSAWERKSKHKTPKSTN